MSEQIEQNLQDFPIGISDWEYIQGKNLFFVDKSAKILKLIAKPRKIFLSRPRRMGKTTLISHIKEYFTARPGTPDAQQVAEQVYVITLKFDEVEGANAAALEQSLQDSLVEAYGAAGIPQASECEAQAQSFGRFLKKLAQLKLDRPLVFLIDEWDKQLSLHLNHKEAFDENLAELRTFYTWLRNLTNIRFILITGIMRYSESSLFTGNDVTDISMDPYWADLVGVTEDELTKYYAPYIREAARRLNWTEAELRTKLKEHYYGFCFDNEAQVKLYCPYSLNNFFRPLTEANPELVPKFQSFWMISANTSHALRNTLNSRSIDLEAVLGLKHKDVVLNEMELRFPQYFSHVQLFPLLAVTGYLSIKGIAEPQNGIPAFRCGLPNLEVATYFEAVVREYLRDNLGLNPYEENLRELQSEQIQTLEEGDPRKICATLNRFLSNIHYDAFMGINEATYLKFLSLWLKSCDLIECAENYNNAGRVDLEVKTHQGQVFVFELKLINFDEPRALQPDTQEATSANAEHKEELRRACLEQIDHKVLTQAYQQVVKNGYGYDYFTIGAKSITAMVLAIGRAQHRILATRAFDHETDRQFWFDPVVIINH